MFPQINHKVIKTSGDHDVTLALQKIKKKCFIQGVRFSENISTTHIEPLMADLTVLCFGV